MRLIGLILAICLPCFAQGQFLSISDLDTARVFTNLDEALEYPDEVYVLELKVKNGQIPEELFQLKNLHALEMKRGRIERLSESFSSLENLIYIDLSNNKLDHFPAVFLEMPQMEEVHLGKNEIRRIPENITLMKNLRVLDIWSNLVPRLPLSLTELPSLQEVDMRMIEVSQEDQDFLEELLPEVKFHFSVPCNCR